MPSDRSSSELRNSVLYRHRGRRIGVIEGVTDSDEHLVLVDQGVLGSSTMPLSHMTPRSVPETAKRASVLASVLSL